MNIRELLIKIGLTGDDNTGRQLDKVDGKVNHLKESFSGLGGVIGGLFAGLSLHALVGVADEMLTIEARLNNLPQTLNKGAAAFDAVAQHASAARMSINAYATFLLRTGNATQDFVKSQDELLSITDTVSKALVVGGATAEEQSSALLQFAQALGSGVLQGDEFRAMSEAAPQLLDAIGKALGYPRDQLKKFASEGKLTTKAIIQALKQIGPQFDAQFKRMPLTFGQAMTVISNRWGAFVNRLNRSSGAITWIADRVLWLGAKAEQGLNLLTEAAGGAENAVKLLGVAVGSAALIGAVYALGAAIQFLFSPITLVIIAVGLLYLAFDDISNWMDGNKSLFGSFFGDFKEYAGYIDTVKTAVDWLLVPLREMAYWLNVITGMSEPPPWLSKLLGIETSVSGENAGPSQINDGKQVPGAPIIGPNGIPTGENYPLVSSITPANSPMAGTGSGMRMGQQFTYSPKVDLTINAPSGDAEAIGAAATQGISNLQKDFTDRAAYDLQYNTGAGF